MVLVTFAKTKVTYELQKFDLRKQDSVVNHLKN